MNVAPKVTVLMSVYKEEDRLLYKSVESVLKQDFKDFEFLIINDGATDNNLQIISNFNDPRIKVIHNPTNIGLTKSLNIGLKEAKSNLIARLDSDDFAEVTRLKKQIQFLDDNPEYVFVGAKSVELVNGKEFQSKVPFLKSDKELRKVFTCFNPFIHSTLMFRRDVALEFSGYDESFRYAQDYKLTFELLKRGKAQNIDEVLVYRTADDTRISAKKEKSQRRFAMKVSIAAAKEFGFSLQTLKYLIKSTALVSLPKFITKIIRS